MRAVPGRGTEGEVQARSYLLGSLRWMDELGVGLGALAARAKSLQNDGATVSALAERTVTVLTRPQGEAKLWLEMARKNAELAVATGWWAAD